MARTKIPEGKLIKIVDCQVDLTFANVPGDAKMYVLADSDNKGWKLMPSEVSPGPAVVDFSQNLPAPL